MRKMRLGGNDQRVGGGVDGRVCLVSDPLAGDVKLLGFLLNDYIPKSNLLKVGVFFSSVRHPHNNSKAVQIGATDCVKKTHSVVAFLRRLFCKPVCSVRTSRLR